LKSVIDWNSCDPNTTDVAFTFSTLVALLIERNQGDVQKGYRTDVLRPNNRINGGHFFPAADNQKWDDIKLGPTRQLDVVSDQRRPV
jgi:hypothetical protein